MSSWSTEHTSSSFDAAQARREMISGRNRDGVQYFGNTGEIYMDFLQGDHNSYGEQSTWEMMKDNNPLNPFNWMDGNNPFGDNPVSGYNLIGIKATQVEPMREAIREYVNNVQTYLDQAMADLETQNAFRGAEAEAAVKAYLEKVKNYVRNLVSTLLAFSDKLADVGNAWISAQENIGQTVNTSSGEFSEGKTYTEAVQYKG